MASLAKFDSEIEKTRATVEEMREKLETSGRVLDEFAKTETIGEVDFDIENARINDVLRQQKVMEGFSALDEAIKWQLGFENRFWRNVRSALQRGRNGLITLRLGRADRDTVLAHIGDAGNRHVAIKTIGQR